MHPDATVGGGHGDARLRITTANDKQMAAIYKTTLNLRVSITRALVGVLLAITLLVALFLRTYELDASRRGRTMMKLPPQFWPAMSPPGRSLPIFHQLLYTGHEGACFTIWRLS